MKQQVVIPQDNTSSFFKRLRDCINPTKGNYFGDFDTCMGLSTEVLREKNLMDEFVKRLTDYNSINIYEYLAKAVITGDPEVYVPREKNYGYSVLTYLTEAGFSVTPYKDDGIFIDLTAYLFSYNEKYFLVADLYKRAIKTRFDIMAVMSNIYSRIVLDMTVCPSKIIYTPPTNYVNLNIVKDLLERLMPVNVVNTGSNLEIEVISRSELRMYPIFGANFQHDEDIACLFLEVEGQATANRYNRRNATIFCYNEQLREMFLDVLEKEYFSCIRKSDSCVFVDWSKGDKADRNSFAYKCWIRSNTVQYYRNCARVITTRLRYPSSEDRPIVLPDSRYPIDSEYFAKLISLYDRRPLLLFEDNNHYVVKIRSDSELTEEQWLKEEN